MKKLLVIGLIGLFSFAAKAKIGKHIASFCAKSQTFTFFRIYQFQKAPADKNHHPIILAC